ncbi:hypothetical protein DMN91_005185 [Ooceraea biroi]|uniref:Peptidase M13 N-terminal domain-containing protein n=1 Tax=Ooceraea biroi TaxID=2015173 RepID=A0A3L8DR72_OOCBI|nr:hypothetical protein DMN91_005185 [Ooceraea biroi]
MRGCYCGWDDGTIDVSLPRHENHWKNVNVWTPNCPLSVRVSSRCSVSSVRSGQWAIQHEQRAQRIHFLLIWEPESSSTDKIQANLVHARIGMMEICDSEDCVRIAASLKGSMNTSVDPCDDFYQYACGRWPLQHPIPDSSFTNSWLREDNTRVSRKIRDLLKANISASEVPWAVMQAKTLYTSCMDVHAMNELGLSSLYDLLGLLNIPVIPASLTNVTSNYIEQIARVKKILGQDIFFGFGIMPDLKNNSRNIIAFYPPELDSPFPRDKELEKRLRTIRSRLRKLEDLDDEATLSEDEDAELTYITDVVNQVINNGTINVCNSDYSIVPKEELDELVETLYTMSNYINYVSTY